MNVFNWVYLVSEIPGDGVGTDLNLCPDLGSSSGQLRKVTTKASSLVSKSAALSSPKSSGSISGMIVTLKFLHYDLYLSTYLVSFLSIVLIQFRKAGKSGKSQGI